MAQGKLKVKSKVPDNVAKKKKQQAQLKKSNKTKTKSRKSPKIRRYKLLQNFTKKFRKRLIRALKLN